MEQHTSKSYGRGNGKWIIFREIMLEFFRIYGKNPKTQEVINPQEEQY